MKNVTISLDDASHRRARIRAAERGVSLSAMVRELLDALDSPTSDKAAEHARLAALEIELRKQVPAEFRASDRLSRDEVHDRRY
jgi:plasmid stability protein